MRPQPWSPADATDAIRALAARDELQLTWTLHIKERLVERDLIIGDVRFLLRHGFVYAEPEPSSRNGLYKYAVEGTSPNSGNRSLRLIVIPDETRCWIKLITLMWVDEGR